MILTLILLLVGILILHHITLYLFREIRANSKEERYIEKEDKKEKDDYYVAYNGNDIDNNPMTPW